MHLLLPETCEGGGDELHSLVGDKSKTYVNKYKIHTNDIKNLDMNMGYKTNWYKRKQHISIFLSRVGRVKRLSYKTISQYRWASPSQ